MRMLCVAASAVGLIVGAACSDGAESRTTSASSTSVGVDAGQSSTTVTTAAPTTTAPPPAPLSREDAAARYLAIVEPYNVALEALEQGVNGGQPVETLRAQAAAVAAANETHMQQLQATLWPADVQPAVDALVAASQQAQAFWLQAAEAPTHEALIAAVVSAGEHDGGTPASTIRNALGLGEYDEDAYS
jgi:hypothetical protein